MTTICNTCNFNNSNDFKDVLNTSNISIHLMGDYGLMINMFLILVASNGEKSYSCVCKNRLEAIGNVPEDNFVHFHLHSKGSYILHNLLRRDRRIVFAWFHHIKIEELTVDLTFSHGYEWRDMTSSLSMLSALDTKKLNIHYDHKREVISDDIKNVLMNYVWHSQTQTVTFKGEGFSNLKNYLCYKQIREVAEIPLCDRPIPIQSDAKSASKR